MTLVDYVILGVVLVSALPGAWILLGGGATPAKRGGLASGEPG